MGSTKRCKKCNQDFPLDEFRTYQSGKRIRGVCKRCERYRRRENHKQQTPERLKSMREGNFRRNYGITLTQYNQMVSQRQGRCDICGEKPNDKRGSKLHVDHVEGTKEIRGLLCLRCNVGIGMLKHSRKIIASAHRYLKR
jgi:hypothetical protein